MDDIMTIILASCFGGTIGLILVSKETLNEALTFQYDEKIIQATLCVYCFLGVCGSLVVGNAIGQVVASLL